MVAPRVAVALGQTPFPIEILDRHLKVLYCNRAYADAFGEPVELGHPSLVFPRRSGHPASEMLAAAQTSGVWKEEVRVQTRTGDWPVRLRIVPLPSLEEVEFAVFYEDMREEIERRDSLVHQQNLLAIRSRQAQTGELLSLIAHQWRQPLTVVMSLIGNIQLKTQIGAPLDPDYLKAKLDRMAESVQFLSETIDSFRNFYAPSKQKTREDLVSLTRKAVDLVLPSLQKIGAIVDFLAPEPAVNAPVFRGEFQQLVVELVNTAQESLAGTGSATSFATVRVEVLRDGDHALVKVGCNGPPIPPELLSLIFEPYRSSGLGLYMAKTIVETHHGGRISVRSSEWTEFTAAFPLEPAS